MARYGREVSSSSTCGIGAIQRAEEVSGTILTVPNELHVQVEANGKWTIANVPARPLKLVFCQQTSTQPSKKEVDVSPCDTAVKVTLEAPIAHVTKENDKPDDAWESYVAAD